MKALKKIGQILATVGVTLTSLLSLITAYILFAPDTLPKPIRIDPPVATPVEASAGRTPVATASPTPIVFLPGQGIIVTPSSKIINLSDPAGNKYIRVTVALEFQPNDNRFLSMTPEEKQAYITAFTNEVNAKMPVIDDTIIAVISTKKYDELYTADGKDALRQQLVDLINARLQGYKVLTLYFTEFVME